MELAAQILANGFMTGGVYALIALGIVMVYKASKLFNFAVGDLMVLGGFICWTFIVMGVPAWISILVTAIIAAILGMLIQQFALRPLIGQPLLSATLATLALSYIIRGVVLLGWQGMVRTYPEFLPGAPVTLGSVTMSHELLWAFFLALAIFGITVFFFQFTKPGLALRATAEDQQLAQVRGIPVGFMFALTWAIASVIAAIGGILLGNRMGLSVPLADYGLKAFPAVLLGGLESIPGAIIGGLTIGLIESMTTGYISPALGQITPFIVLLLVLIFKTEGLFGLERIERI